MKKTDSWKDNDPDKATADQWQKDSTYWIWGLFYFNKEDKRLFVPKKIEWMGMTLNFANKKWIVFMVLLISFYSFIIFMISRKN